MNERISFNHDHDSIGHVTSFVIDQYGDLKVIFKLKPGWWIDSNKPIPFKVNWKQEGF